MAGNEVCKDHSGCMKAIDGLEKTNTAQWTELGMQKQRIDSIHSKLNATLGGIVVACILLLINIFVGK